MTDAYAPPDDPLEIVHADHEILVANKPSGLLSVPGKGPELADCLIARIQAAYPEALLVHRLDRDTSGVMVFALTPHAQRHLGLQFEKRRVRKVYVARVAGVVAEDTGTVDLPLIVDSGIEGGLDVLRGIARGANFVMLGAYLGATEVVPEAAVERAIESEFTGDKAKFVPVNVAAFRAGVAEGAKMKLARSS